MDDVIKKIKEKVVKENPEFKGVEPIVKEEILEVPEGIKKKMKRLGGGIPDSKTAPKKVKVLTFKRFAMAEDGVKIPIVLTVTVDEQGNIIKETGN